MAGNQPAPIGKMNRLARVIAVVPVMAGADLKVWIGLCKLQGA